MNIFNIIIIFILTSNLSFSQSFIINNEVLLSNEIKENSGIIEFNGKIFTHNDSGNNAIIYQLDTVNFEIERRIFIANAQNIDWEDITQDSLSIFIGDFGNNSGTRTNLRILKINKNDLLLNDTIQCEFINFNYSDQTDFTPHDNDTEYDAEAILSLHDSLIIFTKDWTQNITKYYTISKTPGNYSLFPAYIFQTNGMITAAGINKTQDTILILGYNQVLSNFFYVLTGFSDSNIFDGNSYFFNLIDSIGYSQTEGICFNSTGGFYISSEDFTYSYNGQDIHFPAKIYEISIVNLAQNNIINKPGNYINIYPNPANKSIHVATCKNISSVYIYNSCFMLVKRIDNFNGENINIQSLPKGLYFLKTNNNAVSKFVKL